MNAAVLALVIEKPSYGYEVWQRFDARFGSLLEVGTSRIYQAVNGLLEEGLIEELPGTTEGSRRQPRPCYGATARGRRTHREWLSEALRSDPTRLELNQRLLATGANDVLTMLAVIDLYEEACLEEVAALRTDGRAPVAVADAVVDSAAAADPIHAIRDQLLAEERRLVLEARLKWIVFARRQLQAMDR